jgi:hypothetical protein
VPNRIVINRSSPESLKTQIYGSDINQPIQVDNGSLSVTGTVNIDTTTPLSVTGTVNIDTTTPLSVTGTVAIDSFTPLTVSITSMPEVTVVSLPEVTVVSLPEVTVTSLPEVTVVSLPEVTVTSLPEVTVVSLPEVTVVSLPEVTVTSLPEVTVVSLPEVTVVSLPQVSITGSPTVFIGGQPIQVTGINIGSVSFNIESVNVTKGTTTINQTKFVNGQTLTQTDWIDVSKYDRYSYFVIIPSNATVTDNLVQLEVSPSIDPSFPTPVPTNLSPTTTTFTPFNEYNNIIYPEDMNMYSFYARLNLFLVPDTPGSYNIIFQAQY